MNFRHTNPTSSLYWRYVSSGQETERDCHINDSKNDLLENMINSPDYQPDVLRNGIQQGMLLTRGGENHTYNVICRPGDELYAGDMIDAFGEKWIVMEARSDDTTHKTGIMQQCNYHVRFQNHSPKIIERWGYLDISGYSSALNKDTKLQKSEEQLAMYFPYDAETAQLYVDKRLASHIGYDPDGNKMLFTFLITGVNPVSESFNSKDHLLMVKAVRDLYSPSTDSLEEKICDYIEPSDDSPIIPSPDQPDDPIPIKKKSCKILGRNNIRIGTTRKYQCVFYSDDGVTPVENVNPKWIVTDELGLHEFTEAELKLNIPDNDEWIGHVITIILSDVDDTYEPYKLEVEVTGYV